MNFLIIRGVGEPPKSSPARVPSKNFLPHGQADIDFYHEFFDIFYPYSDTCRTCSSITKVYGDVKHHFPCRLCPKNRDSTWANLVSTRK